MVQCGTILDDDVVVRFPKVPKTDAALVAKDHRVPDAAMKVVYMRVRDGVRVE